MTDSDTLARIDQHMLRGNELLAGIDEHLERGLKDTSPQHLAQGAEFATRLEEHVVRCEEVIASTGTSYDDWRYAMRQDSLRNERVLGEISQSLARNTEKLNRHTEDMLAESRAQRAALFKMLDRLDGKGNRPPPPPS
ncbi:MAG: hypothetical protein ACR2LK_00910 [Solirubrobacteraceae bacterium]